MKLTEHRAKALLAERGIRIPRGVSVHSPAEARVAAAELGGRVAVKAQVRSGGRGKAGGIVIAETPDEAASAAARLLSLELAGEPVRELLVEEAVAIAEEHYVAIMIDSSLGRPVVMRSSTGGIEIESMTESIERTVVPVEGLADPDPTTAALWAAFVELDAVLVEVNPLAVDENGDVIALDAKIEIDDAAAFRQAALFADEHVEMGTERERAAAALGLRLIELGGDLAVLANGAGLTMATMDAIEHAGGRPANFLEIGGDSYTKAVPALELVLAQPGVSGLLVNFCGAFARCDVMTAGVIDAWEALSPNLPIAFSISGTGQDEARAIVRDRLGMEPHESMAEAVAAAVDAAARSGS